MYEKESGALNLPFRTIRRRTGVRVVGFCRILRRCLMSAKWQAVFSEAKLFSDGANVNDCKHKVGFGAIAFTVFNANLFPTIYPGNTSLLP